METLVMPVNYVELQENEMIYLDGGVYVSQSMAQGILGVLMMSPATIIAGVIGYSAAVKIVNYFADFGGIYGWIARLVVGVVGAQIYHLSKGLAYTALYGGRDFSWSWDPWNFGVQ